MTYCCPNCGYPSEHKDAKCPSLSCEGGRFIPLEERQLAIDMARDIENPPDDDEFVMPRLSIITDEVRPFYDHACGAKITSKSQRRKLYAAQGLRLKSVAEHKRQYPGEFENKTFNKKAVSYDGQKNHKSIAEREGVRTGDGQRVV